jgi:outer membrane protein TolC
MKKVFLFLLLITGFSKAITLNEVIDIAVKNSLQIKMTETDLKKVYEQIREVKSNIYPQISVNAAYQRFDKNYITGLSLQNRYNASINLNQKLFDKTVFESLKVAKENINLQKAIKEDTLLKVVDTAKRLYLSAVYYKAVMEKKEKSLKYWQENYEFVKSQFEAGLTQKYNLSRTKAQLELAKADYQQSVADYQKALIQLKRYLFLDKITEPEDSLLIYDTDIPQENLLKNNTQLKIIEENIKVKEKEKDFYAASIYPTLNLQLSYETYKTRDFPSLQPAWRKGYIITLSANWILFDGFNRDSKVMQTRLDEIKQKLSYKDTLNNLKQQYESDITDLKSLIFQSKAYEENIKASKEALDYATERYRHGLTNIIEVLDAEKNYLDTQIQYLSIIYQINLKIFDLQFLTGRIK